MNSLRRISPSLLAATMLLMLAPANAAMAQQQQASVWMTTADKAQLLTEQAHKLPFINSSPANESTILIDDTKKYQTIDGFGHALTGGTAQLMMKMSDPARRKLLEELFGHGKDQIATNYIRVTVGASDMNDHVFTYDDMPYGETDPQLRHFSLAPDQVDVIPVLKEIIHIQPQIKILASPWTAPAWMKDNGKAKGGKLKKEFYSAYAMYWVKYLKGMEAAGIRIDALTPQNEPENPKNTPSMVMTSAEEADFIGNYLGPALAKAQLHTKIVNFDHNCDHPNYPIGVLKDTAAAKYTEGSGFHLYLGSIDALTKVHEAFPNKNIYFTEQMVVPKQNATDFGIASPVARLIIGAPENWSRNVLLWNLAADPQNGPHTKDGGCSMCSGAITLDGDNVVRNLAYYVTAHASKFVPDGSVRIASYAAADALPHVAFLTPRKGHVLIVSNPSNEVRTFAIRWHEMNAEAALQAGAVATYVW
jgi:glucosylceramidase